MPSDSLLLNSATRRQLELFTSQPGHALLIAGPPGSGKKYLARRLSTKLLGSELQSLNSHPYFIVLSKPPDKSEIPIDAARELIKKMSLKVPGINSGVRRIAVIEDAGLMSLEAQNALLKLLEEPPAGSLIILTASSPGDVLPTIASRMQKISVLPAGPDESQKFFSGQYSLTEIESQWQLSQGAVGLLCALLAQSKDHPLRQAVAQAKEFLKMTTYQRFSYLRLLTKDKAELGLFLEALSKVLAALQLSGGRRANSVRILNGRRVVNDSLISLSKNTNPRLLVLDLVLNMPL